LFALLINPEMPEKLIPVVRAGGKGLPTTIVTCVSTNPIHKCISPGRAITEIEFC